LYLYTMPHRNRARVTLNVYFIHPTLEHVFQVPDHQMPLPTPSLPADVCHEKGFIDKVVIDRSMNTEIE
jgi:hypothetical protein